uniref:UTP6 small subunit processome component n=1 Tax=Sander lucioperca TaxID=283035 RepID=A0A8D0ARP3_SANLU
MAEIVQHRIEERIPELEQLERVGLFTKKEYEINVLELIKKRRAHIHYQFKKEEIEFPVIHRINSVFRRATNKWKDDVQLWLSHVAFCKKWATKGQISKVFSAMLAIHPDKPALWIMAAKNELEDRNSSESARHLFLRALRFHPDNKKVYQEYFRMELLHCEKLRKQKKELEKAEMDLGEYEFSPEILSGKLAEVVYRDATGKIKEAEFVISLLNIAAIFDFTKELQDFILDLQYETCNFLYNIVVAILPNKFINSIPLVYLAHTANVQIQLAYGNNCCACVLCALEPMWTCYVAFCLERLKRKTNVQELKEKRQERQLGVLQRAHDSSLLKEEYYKNWLQILLSSGDVEGAASVAMAATQRYSQSVSVWSLSLRTLMQLGSGDVGRLFQEALTHVNPKVHRTLPLWQLQVQWSVANQSPEETEAVFKVVHLNPPDSMKERYLDWSYSTGGYKKCRKTFTSLQENRPLSKAFFTRMIEIEKEQETPKMNNLRDYYERALQEFGTSDDDLWLHYIQEELGAFGQPENCGKIHWRAMKFLEGESVERFTSKYTLLQTGHL